MNKNKKDLHILISNNLFEKIQSEAKNNGVSLNKTIENLLKKAFVKQSNDYSELIDFIDRRVVQKVDLSLVNFKYFLEKSKAETPKTETKKPPETSQKTQEPDPDYAKKFFEKMSKL